MVETLQKTEIIPFLYQDEALQCVDNAEAAGQKHALVVMASGLGKTIVAALHTKRRLERNSKTRVLFFCHQNNILEQAQTRFEEVLGSEIIYGFFHGEEKTPGAQILFASFQTMRDHLAEFDPEEFDLIVVDESHHTMAETYLPAYEYFKPEFTLAITATPDRSDDQDITEIYGKAVYELSLPDALARGLLCPIEYKLMTDELSSLKVLETEHGKMSIGRLNRLVFIPKRDEEIVRIIQEEMALIENPRMMIFCSSIEHSERMAEFISDSVPIHSKVSPAEKRIRVQFFRDGTFPHGVTVDMFNEALDVPEINLVVFLRNTNEERIFHQQLGRGLRPHKSKTKVVILDFVGNCERINTIYSLHKQIEEKRKSEYEKEHSGERLKIAPFLLNIESEGFKEKIVPLLELIGRLGMDFYPTWQEAAEACRNLKITSYTEYQEGYKKDPRLHSCPNLYYSDYPGLKVFFKKEWKVTMGISFPCLTWQDASKAVFDLEIKDMDLYKKRYKNNKHLPEDPRSFFSDYPGDDIFFSTTYSTWQEASKAAIALGLTDGSKYRKGYSKDPRLPAKPYKFYPDYPGSKNFFPTYYVTWAEACEAIKKLDVANREEYREKRKLDPKLPSEPSVYYSDFTEYPFTTRKTSKTVFYSNWKRASVAARRLGITNSEEYKRLRTKDPLLPSNPSEYYPDYPGLPVFLDMYYRTWQKAANAAKQLGITKKSEYFARYKEDSKLVSYGNLRLQYKDFPGSRIFFGGKKMYETLEETMRVVHELKLNSKDEYRLAQMQDSALPSNPAITYKTNFPGWPKFLGKS